VIKVIVLGNRGEGKTATALAIALFLKELGNGVELCGRDEENTKWLNEEAERIAKYQTTHIRFCEKKTIQVFDCQ
jgi:DNA helicase TIP49 (TBP-interacting protein)